MVLGPESSWDHPALAKAGFDKVTCEGKHRGIILPRQPAGAIILASSWHSESGSAEKKVKSQKSMCLASGRTLSSWFIG